METTSETLKPTIFCQVPPQEPEGAPDKKIDTSNYIVATA